MNHISFAEFLEGAHRILGEAPVIERLRRNNDLKLDSYLVNSAFIESTPPPPHSILPAVPVQERCNSLHAINTGQHPVPSTQHVPGQIVVGVESNRPVGSIFDAARGLRLLLDARIAAIFP